MTRHKHGISALVSQTSFYGETNGGVGKCRLFTQARQKAKANKQTNKENKKHQSEEKINDQI